LVGRPARARGACASVCCLRAAGRWRGARAMKARDSGVARCLVSPVSGHVQCEACRRGRQARRRVLTHPRAVPSWLSRSLRPRLPHPPKKQKTKKTPHIPQVDDDASPEDVKAAYRYLAKTCHPDVHADGHDLCILLNEAYECLADGGARAAYDARLQTAIDAEADGYTGEPLSKWLVGHKMGRAPPTETRAVFVDEFACIGCKNCIFEAAATFRVEGTHGRSRVFAQWVDPEHRIQQAIDSCPVSCIHWVDKADLSALEYVTQKVLTERTNVGMMMAGAGGRVEDPFAAASRFVRTREAAAAARVAAAAAAADASPARAAARAAAAEAIRREQFGMFAGVAAAFSSAVGSVAGAPTTGGPARGPTNRGRAGYAESESDDGRETVGTRRRARRRRLGDVGGGVNEGGGMVPDERALVLARREDE